MSRASHHAALFLMVFVVGMTMFMHTDIGSVPQALLGKRPVPATTATTTARVITTTVVATTHMPDVAVPDDLESFPSPASSTTTAEPNRPAPTSKPDLPKVTPAPTVAARPPPSKSDDIQAPSPASSSKQKQSNSTTLALPRIGIFTVYRPDSVKDKHNRRLFRQLHHWSVRRRVAARPKMRFFPMRCNNTPGELSPLPGRILEQLDTLDWALVLLDTTLLGAKADLASMIPPQESFYGVQERLYDALSSSRPGMVDDQAFLFLNARSELVKEVLSAPLTSSSPCDGSNGGEFSRLMQDLKARDAFIGDLTEHYTASCTMPDVATLNKKAGTWINIDPFPFSQQMLKFDDLHCTLPLGYLHDYVRHHHAHVVGPTRRPPRFNQDLNDTTVFELNGKNATPAIVTLASFQERETSGSSVNFVAHHWGIRQYAKRHHYQRYGAPLLFFLTRTIKAALSAHRWVWVVDPTVHVSNPTITIESIVVAATKANGGVEPKMIVPPLDSAPRTKGQLLSSASVLIRSDAPESLIDQAFVFVPNFKAKARDLSRFEGQLLKTIIAADVLPHRLGELLWMPEFVSLVSDELYMIVSNETDKKAPGKKSGEIVLAPPGRLLSFFDATAGMMPKDTADVVPADQLYNPSAASLSTKIGYSVAFMTSLAAWMNAEFKAIDTIAQDVATLTGTLRLPSWEEMGKPAFTDKRPAAPPAYLPPKPPTAPTASPELTIATIYRNHEESNYHRMQSDVHYWSWSVRATQKPDKVRFVSSACSRDNLAEYSENALGDLVHSPFIKGVTSDIFRVLAEQLPISKYIVLVSIGTFAPRDVNVMDVVKGLELEPGSIMFFGGTTLHPDIPMIVMRQPTSESELENLRKELLRYEAHNSTCNEGGEAADLERAFLKVVGEKRVITKENNVLGAKAPPMLPPALTYFWYPFCQWSVAKTVTRSSGGKTTSKRKKLSCSKDWINFEDFCGERLPAGDIGAQRFPFNNPMSARTAIADLRSRTQARLPSGAKPIERKAKFGILSVYSSSRHDIDRLHMWISSRWNKEQYAALNGYHLIWEGAGMHVPGRSRHWAKLAAIAKWLPHYDWLWCVDVDTIVMNATMTLESVVERATIRNMGEVPNYIIVAQQSTLNTGSILLRNVPKTFTFLREVLYADIQTWQVYEQGALNDVVFTNPAFGGPTVTEFFQNGGDFDVSSGPANLTDTSIADTGRNYTTPGFTAVVPGLYLQGFPAGWRITKPRFHDVLPYGLLVHFPAFDHRLPMFKDYFEHFLWMGTVMNKNFTRFPSGVFVPPLVAEAPFVGSDGKRNDGRAWADAAIVDDDPGMSVLGRGAVSPESSTVPSSPDRKDVSDAAPEQAEAPPKAQEKITQPPPPEVRTRAPTTMPKALDDKKSSGKDFDDSDDGTVVVRQK